MDHPCRVIMSLHGVTVIWILTLIFRLEAREQQKNILHLWSHELSYARRTFLGTPSISIALQLSTKFRDFFTILLLGHRCLNMVHLKFG